MVSILNEKFMNIYIYIYMMMPFFIRNWAGAIGGRWAGPRLLDGLNWRMLDRLGSRSSGLG